MNNLSITIFAFTTSTAPTTDITRRWMTPPGKFLVLIAKKITNIDQNERERDRERIKSYHFPFAPAPPPPLHPLPSLDVYFAVIGDVIETEINNISLLVSLSKKF